MDTLNWGKVWFSIALTVFICFIAYLLFAPLLVILVNRSNTYLNVNEIPAKSVAIVLGAEVRSNGEPSKILYDRIRVGAELYQADKVEKIIVSGDNRIRHNFETDSMAMVLVRDFGIPEEDIIEDEAGLRTYESCMRGKELFKVEDAILVSQGYHLYRATFLCNTLGISSIGMNATLGEYRGENWFKLREFFAIHKAILDLYVKAPETTLK